MLALVVVCVAGGWTGPGYVRFAQFIRSPSETFSYALRVLRHSEVRYLGHNPLGGWMVLALLLTVALTGLSGWLYITDAYWGVEWVGNLHEALAILVLVLAALHVAGVVFTSFRHRENLVAAMFHGRKRGARDDDVA